MGKLEKYRRALEQIANLVNVTETRGEFEHWFTPGHLLDEEGWGPIHPKTLQGMCHAAEIAQEALKED